MAQTEKRGRGRPKKEPKQGERNPLGLRVTAKLKKALEGAAERSGRSLGQEAEIRLERSIEEDDLITRTFGDDKTFRYMTTIALAKDVAEAKTGLSMFEDWETFILAQEAMKRVIDLRRPPRKLTPALASRVMQYLEEKEKWEAEPQIVNALHPNYKSTPRDPLDDVEAELRQEAKRTVDQAFDYMFNREFTESTKDDES